MYSSSAYRIKAYHFKRDSSGKLVFLRYVIERKPPHFKRTKYKNIQLVWSISDSFIKRERLHLYFDAKRYLIVTIKFAYSKNCNVTDTHIQIDSSNFAEKIQCRNKIVFLNFPSNWSLEKINRIFPIFKKNSS